MISCGSTAANTGLLQFLHDKSLTSLIHTFGEEKGVRAYKLCYEALRTMEKVVPTLDIDPQFIPRSSLYYASKSEDVSFYKKNTKRYRIMSFQLSILQHLILRNGILLQDKRHYIHMVMLR